MSAFSRWFSPISGRFRSSVSSSGSSSPNPGNNRVLHGRVSKPGHTSIASNPRKYQAFVKDIGDGEDSDEVSGPVKLEEEDHSEDSANETSGDEPALEEAKAMMAHVRYSYDSTPSQPSNHEHVHGEDSADETDVETNEDKAWRLEQIYINMVLNARNEFSLMPSTWKMHFRGIPLPDSLFYDKQKATSIRPRIYARTNKLEYRGALSLRKLIEVHGRIQDIRNDEATAKNDKDKDEADKRKLIATLSAEIVKQLRRALEQVLDWSKQDGGIDKYGDQLPPNVRVMELRDLTMTDEPDYEFKIQVEMCKLAEDWRAHAADGEAPAPAQLPVLFGFVIIKHIITIVTMDASDPNAIMHVPCQLHMAEKNQHQWNALAILVTICWARDVLLNYINARPDLQPEVKAESSDPDA
ncbi:hypothetical protein F4808DRAFT_407336 [Astrocystis sublimbata]|nr:hypothetical protein F4808DRAFT_407336 [Astrocystis sublimbata]